MLQQQRLEPPIELCSVIGFAHQLDRAPGVSRILRIGQLRPVVERDRRLAVSLLCRQRRKLRLRGGPLRLELQRSLKSLSRCSRVARPAQRTPAQLVEESLVRVGGECGLRRLERFRWPACGDEVFDERGECGAVERTGEVEAGVVSVTSFSWNLTALLNPFSP